MKNRFGVIFICVGLLVVTGTADTPLAQTQKGASSSHLTTDARNDGATAPMPIMDASKITCGRGTKGYSQEDCDWLYQSCCQSSPFLPAAICEDVWIKENCDGCYHGCGSGW